LAVLAVAITTALVVAVGVAGARSRVPILYSNCSHFNAKYAHGVGRAGARDRTKRSDPVTTFVRSTRIYNIAIRYKRGLDREKDRVACEKKRRRPSGRSSRRCASGRPMMRFQAVREATRRDAMVNTFLAAVVTGVRACGDRGILYPTGRTVGRPALLATAVIALVVGLATPRSADSRQTVTVASAVTFAGSVRDRDGNGLGGMLEHDPPFGAAARPARSRLDG
jgi:hypothetical protein